MTAKIKLNAASGGGSISIQAPSSSSNNRVITLPDVADGTLLTTTNESKDYVKLQQATSAGGSGGLVFDNLDVATYKYFDFIVSFVPETDNQHPQFRFRTGGASGSLISGNHYGYGYHKIYQDGAPVSRLVDDVGYIRLADAIGNNTSEAEGIALSMRIHFADSSDNGGSAALANFITWQYCSKNVSGVVRNGQGTGQYHENTSTYPTGFQIYMDSGAINAHSYALYGLKR